jgi:hypothetical protein
MGRGKGWKRLILLHGPTVDGCGIDGNKSAQGKGWVE